MSIVDIPTVALLAELRRREEAEHYVVDRIPPFSNHVPEKWALWREGAIKQTVNGPVKAYLGFFTVLAAAEEICAMLNDRAERRRAAHTAGDAS